MAARSQSQSSFTAEVMRELGLRRARPETLTIRRKRNGRGFVYLHKDNRRIRDPGTLKRLTSLAVPPAYEDVMFAEDPALHLQAIGRDAAGRIQYRYHPDWQKVRERRKARRLMRLVDVMPKIRRAVAARLCDPKPTKEFALAAVIDLVACSAIRAGSETYARENGTRGAATLLKSNVAIDKNRIVLTFRAKRGQPVHKEVTSQRLAAATRFLQSLPGRRLFQYRNGQGEICKVRRSEVNSYLREIAGVAVSLKDFRTLVASDLALAELAKTKPASSERRRRRQVREAVSAAAEELANTPAICRKSYVHESIVDAFENGAVMKFAPKLGTGRSRARREGVLAEILAMSES
jgi:DNA topoisomerase-1